MGLGNPHSLDKSECDPDAQGVVHSSRHDSAKPTVSNESNCHSNLIQVGNPLCYLAVTPSVDVL